MKTLHPYQQRAITYLYERDGVQAVLPMGAGKTAIMLTAAQEMLRDGAARRGLVVAPKRVATLTWPQEPAGWPHLAGLDVVPATGDATRRAKVLASDAPLVSIGVDNLPWLMDWLSEQPDNHPLLDLLMIDELSTLKAPRGKRARSLSMQSTRFSTIWGATGTPRPNSLLDQYQPMKVLTRGQLWSQPFDAWRMRYFAPTDYQQKQWEVRDEWIDKLHGDVASVSFRVPDDELARVPIKTVDHYFGLVSSQRNAYDDMLRKLVISLGLDHFTGEHVLLSEAAAANAAVAAGKLSQIVSGFVYGKKDGKQTVAARYDEEKLARLQELLDAAGGDGVVIVYTFREELQSLRTLLPDAPVLGDDVADAEAEAAFTAWNSRRVNRLILHAKSAGHGLNLQHGGNQLIFYTVPWSPEQYNQVVARLARQGQTAAYCTVHRLLAYNTIDTLKVSRLQQKTSDENSFVAVLPAV